MNLQYLQEKYLQVIFNEIDASFNQLNQKVTIDWSFDLVLLYML